MFEAVESNLGPRRTPEVAPGQGELLREMERLRRENDEHRDHADLCVNYSGGTPEATKLRLGPKGG